MFKRRVLRVGYGLVVLGALLFTPLFDLLLVDLLVRHTLQLGLIGAGILLVLAARLMGPRR